MWKFEVNGREITVGLLHLFFVFQFDNFKRVFKVVEELKGPLVENIRQNFILSDKLARYCLLIRSTHKHTEPCGLLQKPGLSKWFQFETEHNSLI